MKFIIHLFFCFFTTLSFANPILKIENNATALIRLKVIDSKNNPIVSKVFFKDENKSYAFESNKNGEALCKVPIDNHYTVSIANSTTTFDYDVLDFENQDINLTLKFELSSADLNEATADKALLIFNFFNVTNNAKVEIIDLNTNKIIASTSTSSLRIQVPDNSSLILKINDWKIKNNTLKIEKAAYKTLYFIVHIEGPKKGTMYKAEKETFFNVNFTNVATGLAGVDEPIEVLGRNNKKIFSSTTNENGTCLIRVPNNDIYDFNLKYDKAIVTKYVENDYPLNLINCNFTYLGYRDIERIKHEDSSRLAIRDSLYKIYEKVKEKTSVDLLTDARLEAEMINKEIAKNPNIIKQLKNTVCAILYRNSKNWHSKMIVTDVTGSMYPYWRQILVWHSMQMMTKENNDYVFFNDGDNTPDKEKRIGKTGGIYYTESDEAEAILKKMMEATSRGSGGDGPENNIEALIYAQKYKKGLSEMIMIADNYAPVKDIELLMDIKVPIKVIVCGASTNIHPDYIKIAFKTKGSIHTIEEDIINLEKVVEGSTITIGNKKYIYSHDNFILLKY
jgi:hypothetical protein